MLAQQIRDPQAGRFLVTIAAQGSGSSRAFYEQFFQRHFRCRLVIFQFTESAKNPRQHRELASLEFCPVFRDAAVPGSESFALDKFLGNPGGNFSFGLGIGLAILVERSTDGGLDLPAHSDAYLVVERVDVKFEGLVL